MVHPSARAVAVAPRQHERHTERAAGRERGEKGLCLTPFRPPSAHLSPPSPRRQSLRGNTSAIQSVLLDASEELAVAGGAAGAVKLWDLVEGRAIRTMTGHKAAPIALDLYSAGGLCASLSPADGTARVWDPRQKEAAHVFRGMGAGDAGEGGGAVGGGGAEGRGAGAGGGAECGGKGGKPVGCVRFSPDGRWVVAGGQDGRIKLFDLAQGRLFAQLAGHAGAVAALDFHPQELLLASAARDRTVRWWDLESLDCVDCAPPGAGGTTALAFSPQGDALFAPCTDHLKFFLCPGDLTILLPSAPPPLPLLLPGIRRYVRSPQREGGGVGRGERGDRGSAARCSSEGGWWGREGKGGRGGVVAAVVLGRDDCGDKGWNNGGYTTGGDTSTDDECTSHRLARGGSGSHGATTTTTAAAAATTANGHTASRRSSHMQALASPRRSPPSSSPSNPTSHSPAPAASARTALSSSATPVTVTPDARVPFAAAAAHPAYPAAGRANAAAAAASAAATTPATPAAAVATQAAAGRGVQGALTGRSPIVDLVSLEAPHKVAFENSQKGRSPIVDLVSRVSDWIGSLSSQEQTGAGEKRGGGSGGGERRKTERGGSEGRAGERQRGKVEEEGGVDTRSGGRGADAAAGTAGGAPRGASGSAAGGGGSSFGRLGQTARRMTFGSGGSGGGSNGDGSTHAAAAAAAASGARGSGTRPGLADVEGLANQKVAGSGGVGRRVSGEEERRRGQEKGEESAVGAAERGSGAAIGAAAAAGGSGGCVVGRVWEGSLGAGSMGGVEARAGAGVAQRRMGGGAGDLIPFLREAERQEQLQQQEQQAQQQRHHPQQQQHYHHPQQQQQQQHYHHPQQQQQGGGQASEEEAAVVAAVRDGHEGVVRQLAARRQAVRQVGEMWRDGLVADALAFLAVTADEGAVRQVGEMWRDGLVADALAFLAVTADEGVGEMWRDGLVADALAFLAVIADEGVSGGKGGSGEWGKRVGWEERVSAEEGVLVDGGSAMGAQGSSRSSMAACSPSLPSSPPLTALLNTPPLVPPSSPQVLVDVVSAMGAQGNSSMAGGGVGGGASAAVQCLGVDGCAALVPILGGLLASAHSSRVHAALLLLRALLRCYGDGISAARSAVHSPGVDLHMEMRLQRCAECAEAFHSLAPHLHTLLHSGSKENRSLATQVHMLTARLSS
ncbi:unnamed protein product [Closterium sp. Naga37s-1]|nr:unnamed protein product [Closterium sp. Naga37s-1]